MNTRYQYIDIFRALAIILVTGFHLWRIQDKPHFEIGPFDLFAPFQHGKVGVTLFFFISGYCMALAIKRTKQSELLTYEFYKNYLIKRIIRIIPAYYVALIFWNVFLSLDPRDLASHTLKDNILHILFLHNLEDGSVYSVSGVFWSIAVEMQFYFIFPVVLFLVLKYTKWSIIGTGFITLFICYGFPEMLTVDQYKQNLSAISTNLLNYLFLFVLGIVSFTNKSSMKLFTRPILIFPAVLVLLLDKPIIEHPVFFEVAVGALLGLVMVSLSEYKFKGFGWFFLGRIGLYSYSIYLYNYIFLIYSDPVSKGIYGWLFYFTLIFAFGIFMYYTVERPAQYLKKFSRPKLNVIKNLSKAN